MDGIGRYTRNLVSAVVERSPDDEFVLFKIIGVDFSFVSSFPNVRLREVPYNHLSPRTVFDLGRRLERENLDLFHVPFFVGPRRCPVPMVVTVHDLMALTFKGFFSHRGPIGQRLAEVYHRWFVPGTIRRADLILADSTHTRNEIIRFLGIDPPKIEVVHPWSERSLAEEISQEKGAEIRHSAGLFHPYVMYVGNAKPYKNIPGLLRGFAHFVSDLLAGDRLLLMAGIPDKASGWIRAEGRRLGIAGRMRILGHVSDRDLGALLSGAEAFCFPSLEEGFGLPVLEAMSVGTPVVTSGCSSLPEVGGDAVLYADPDCPREIGQALARICLDPAERQRLSQAGFRQAQKFDKDISAGRVVDLYRRVARCGD